MRIYAATGQYALAIRQYRDCCRKLEREIGVKPDEKTEQLYRDVVARRPVVPSDAHEVEENRQPPRPRSTRPEAPAVSWLRAVVSSRLGVAAICAAALVVVGAVALAVVSAAAARPRIITVFPLVVISGDGAPEPFALGMADALVTELAGVSRLEVRSAGNAGPQDVTSSRGAAALARGAAFYVEGSVVRVNEQVRVSLRLFEARQSASRWGEVYTGSIADPLVLQSAIATDARAHIVEKLGLQ
jgi:TolB-like protein